jgi:hypothetical protein
LLVGTGAAAMKRFNVVASLTPAEFVAVSVTVKEPDCVGVPVINPVVEFSVKPVGRPEAE